MRIAFFFLLSFATLLVASTQDKIIKNKKNLKNTSKIEKQIYKKMNSIAKDIIKGEKSLNDANINIAQLEEQIKDLKSDSKSTQAQLNVLTRENQRLVKTRKELEEKIIDIIADKFSFYLVTDKGYQESEESIIGNEVLSKMDVILKKDFQDLNRAYDNTNETINKHNKQIKNIQNSLKKLSQKQKSLKRLKKQRQNSVSNLKKKKSIYKRKLDKIAAQRDELQKTLKRLKILKYQEDEDAKRKKEEKLAKKRPYKKGTLNKKVGVKQVGSSYQQSRVKRYRGSKTISPLSSYIVKQKFGNYIDPIYKIKIFNESVVLRSKTKNAKVRNVLSGKVIFAKNTAMLNKVVIIENRLGIHTIYAHMDKIAPTIKVGKKIKKGYIIGRVERDLTFEVTQKNYHINPLQLIR